MTKSHERMEKSIGCGAVVEARFPGAFDVICKRDSGNLCPRCRLRRDVCAELTAALADSALIDTLERINEGPLRASWRTLADARGLEIRCSKSSERISTH